MEESKFARRKNWIKNAIIVFLVVMLLLTFFSNTIMNHSLPQVVTQYVSSGTITTKIRGSGVVESGDPYNVMVKATRKVSGIAVKEGQKVTEGQVLLYLAEGESDEYEAQTLSVRTAERALEDAQEAYDKKYRAILAASITDGDSGSVTASNFLTLLREAQAQVDAAQAEADAVQGEIDAAQVQADAAQAEVDAAQRNVDTANAAVTRADEAISETNARITELEAQITELAGTTADTAAEEAAVAKAQTEVDSAQEKYNTWAVSVSQKETQIKNLEELIAYYDAKTVSLNDEETKNYKSWKSQLETAQYELIQLQTAKGYAESALATAQNNLTAAQTALTRKNESFSPDVSALKSQVASEKNTLAQQKKDLTEKKSALTDAGEVLTEKKDALAAAQSGLSAKQTELTKKQERVSELTTSRDALFTRLDSGYELQDLAEAVTDAREELAREQEKLDKLKTDSAEGEVTAPISGTILSINVASGKETDPATPVVTIQPEGQGYTLSFTVTNEQAKLLSVGDPADLVNSWWYSDITAKVSQIKPDPQSPNQNRLVVCSLEGDGLTAGQSLTLSIGSRSSNYDTIVPTSAIHEDNNGKFVLIVEAKSSPLGNRYYAVRYDVTVLASDDTQSAISSALYGYEYVITTSTKPINAGDLVRLSE